MILRGCYFFQAKTKIRRLFRRRILWLGIYIASFKNLTIEELKLLAELRNRGVYENMSRQQLESNILNANLSGSQKTLQQKQKQNQNLPTMQKRNLCPKQKKN